MNKKYKRVLYSGQWGGAVLLALLVSLVLPRPARADAPFGSQSIISTGANVAFSVTTADVDGDGDLDLAVVRAAVERDAQVDGRSLRQPLVFLQAFEIQPVKTAL